MKIKHQVFISSTYLDLKDERQAAVEAILSAGHIPAGMELFNAGNDSQLVTIKKWIDESDIYMLILGGRYGSIDTNSKKSYTELEYRYAIEKGKPVFAVYISETGLKKKAQILGGDAIASLNDSKYRSFRKLVLSKVCREFEDCKDIKIAVLETLNSFSKEYALNGWISAIDIKKIKEQQNEIADLKTKNRDLEQQLHNKPSSSIMIGSHTFEDVHAALVNYKIRIPSNKIQLPGAEVKYTNVFILFGQFMQIFSSGIYEWTYYPRDKNWDTEIFLAKNCIAQLLTFGLIKRDVRKNETIYFTSENGYNFAAECEKRRLKNGMRAKNK